MSTTKRVLPAPVVRIAINRPDLEEISEQLEEVQVVITGLLTGERATVYYHLSQTHPTAIAEGITGNPVVIPLNYPHYRGYAGETASIYYEIRPGGVSQELSIEIVK
ncbi:hypothetical protein SB766_20605 [Pseudomonas sp. SIMBA_077]